MARSKSTSGGKSNRSTPNPQQQPNNSSPANIPEVNAVAAGTTVAEVAAEVKANPEPRKMAVVRSEPRKNGSPNLGPINLVPINLDDEIRRRAYELYQQRGTASGSEAEDWLTAERVIKQRYRKQQSA